MEMKQRGQKHHKNKARYQNKSKIISKPTNLDDELHESNSKIQNNWDRYEEPEENEVTDDSTNFSVLAQAPLSHSGYFQFKSQKDVQSQFDFDQFQSNKIFSLDLNLLSLCLGTIPFHDRCNIDEQFLEEPDIQESDNQARECLIQYKNYMSSVNPNSEFLPKIDEVTFREDLNGHENLLQQIDKCNLHKNIENVEKVGQEIEKNDEDLEQWLDDFLDD